MPCVLPLHPHGQASLLRSHAGGFSVVSTTECMLYAASEVSVIHRTGSLALHLPSLALPPLPPLPTTTFFCLTFPVLFLSSPLFYLLPCRYPEWCVSTLLLPASSSFDFVICKLSMVITPPHPAALCAHIFTNTRCQKGKPEQRKLIRKVQDQSQSQFMKSY